MEKHIDRSYTMNIETPAILKSCRKSSRSPNPITRSTLPPNKSGLLTHSQLLQPQNFHDENNNSIIIFGYPERMKEKIIEKFVKIGNVENIKKGGGN